MKILENVVWISCSLLKDTSLDKFVFPSSSFSYFTFILIILNITNTINPKLLIIINADIINIHPKLIP